VAKGLTIGHEPVGVIEKLGAAVQGYKEGQRVIAGAITPSGYSNACLCGCLSQDGAGTKHGFKPLGGVAVIADHTWAAMRGRAVLDVAWDAGDNGGYDSVAYHEALSKSLEGASKKVMRHKGDAEAAVASAAKRVTAEYHTPHLAHAPMEPPVAVADTRDGSCEVWTSTQNPQASRTEVAKVLGVDEKNVTVHVTLLGGGFGRKSKPDYVVEAALLSREAKAPVRLQWSREDDVQHDYYHSTSAQRLTAGLDASASAHNLKMAGGCGLTHECPGEPAIGARETAAGVSWTAAGENIGEGGPMPDTTAAMARMAVTLTQDMLNEQPPDDGHRLNILSSTFTHIGIAVYRDSSGTVWMTQDFSN